MFGKTRIADLFVRLAIIAVLAALAIGLWWQYRDRPIDYAEHIEQHRLEEKERARAEARRKQHHQKWLDTCKAWADEDRADCEKKCRPTPVSEMSDCLSTCAREYIVDTADCK